MNGSYVKIMEAFSCTSRRPLVNLVIVKTNPVDTDSWGQLYRAKRDVESAYIMCTGMIVLLESRKCSSVLAMKPRRVP